MENTNEILNDSIPTNEEIVDSLVKNLEDSCQIKSAESQSEKSVPNEEYYSDNCVGEKLDDSSQENINKNISDEDYIDEEDLKEKEKSYTDEDKVKLHLKAAEFKKLGNEQFKSSQFREAITTYTLALRTCPLCYTKDRAVLYANRGAARLSIQLTESAIDDCGKAIELDPDYVKAIIRRAQLYEKTDKLDEALADYKRVLELDSSNKEATMANMRLPPLINERNEKLKTEMLGKLKDLGNMVLKPFGLSTNNFQMVQNESGGYSINFKK